MHGWSAVPILLGFVFGMACFVAWLLWELTHEEGDDDGRHAELDHGDQRGGAGGGGDPETAPPLN